MSVRSWIAFTVFVLAAPLAHAQEGGGIPVQNDVVRAKCGSCHRSDDKGRMSRISYRRATPENWEKTISTCRARPLCSGGCYHEAHTRHGDTERPNLHYCDWIRGWTDVCLEIYGELAVRNPAFLTQFDDEPAKEPVS